MANNMHYEWVWSKCVALFPILGKSSAVNLPESKQNDALNELIAELTEMGIADSVRQSVWLAIEEKIRTAVVPQFWAHFGETAPAKANSADSDSDDDELTEQLCYKFQIAITEMYSQYMSMQLNVNAIADFEKLAAQKGLTLPHSRFDSPQTQYTDTLKAMLLSALPFDFERVVLAFYRKSFRQYKAHVECMDRHSRANGDSDDSDDDMSEPAKCERCDRRWPVCVCDPCSRAFVQTGERLREMSLMDELASGPTRMLLFTEVRRYVQHTAHGQYDKSHMERMNKWMDDVAMAWYGRVLGFTADGRHDDGEPMRVKLLKYTTYYTQLMWKAYGQLLIDQFFNIIIDYPDSQPAIDDLKKICLKADFQCEIAEKVKEALQMRLLHPGVNTNDILTGYVASIKALRYLDETGVLLESIIEPVKDYMRSRPDTVRCVVSALTEEGPADLAEELAKSEAASATKQQKDGMNMWRDWMPDPVNVDVQICRLPVNASNRRADIISMIVDIYGSKEMFVTEYRNLLADRLLTQLDFSPEKEVRNLELLKLRFGDSVLHNCEVMLKDIWDSKRIDSHIHDEAKAKNNPFSFDISSLILSSQFWPQFKTETLRLPKVFADEFARYKKSYESYKANRTLDWRPVTGSVELEIELGSRTIELTVTPTQASIITLFVDQKRWTLANMSAQLDVPATVLRIRLAFWQSHGLLREEHPDVFVLVADEAAMPGTALDADDAIECDDGTESAMASASDQREEDLQVFWSYIVGMLTNLDSMQLERIHQMLKMFASHGPGAEFTQDELKNFLQRKVREHKLIFTGGVYQLPK